MTSTGPSFGAKARENASMRPHGFFRSMTLKKSKQKRKRNASGNPRSARVNGGGAGGTTGCENTKTGLATLFAITTAVKPFFLRFLLARGADTVVFLDPDIQVLAPLDELGRLARAHAIV